MSGDVATEETQNDAFHRRATRSRGNNVRARNRARVALRFLFLPGGVKNAGLPEEEISEAGDFALRGRTAYRRTGLGVQHAAMPQDAGPQLPNVRY
ncbi:hypothetical protein AU512_12945 [Lonsdalea iberica]|uniref:Uncharacterized protein n=1 Tax=Lonsdalea iberica TaxID=1082703 RepID=A0ABX3XDR5_9GAMM|nr:hypothetical protein AU512_12945 [Lonsdalea iberica]